MKPVRETAPVSRENVEIVRRIYEAVARRDASTPFELYAEDIVWDASRAPTAALLDKQVYHGHEGVREFWRGGLDLFGEIDLEIEEIIDAGDRVVVEVREREVGRRSGVPVEITHFALWTLADGKATRLEIFSTRAEALAAAGI